jgi:hypothetical protein
MVVFLACLQVGGRVASHIDLRALIGNEFGGKYYFEDGCAKLIATWRASISGRSTYTLAEVEGLKKAIVEDTQPLVARLTELMPQPMHGDDFTFVFTWRESL